LPSVVVAISGGVDSSVAAALLVDRGYRVIGVTFKNFDLDGSARDDYSNSCCSVQAGNDARSVCARLGIPHYVLNRVEQFHARVVADFKASYHAGTTPNPCVRCNTLVRWPELVRLADGLGFDFIATGHYATIGKANLKGFGGRRLFIQRSPNKAKDQSYALWGISRQFLDRTLFPVGTFTKEKTRAIAAEYGFTNASAAESQDLCFVPEGEYVRLMDDASPGEIVDREGRVLGKHTGLTHYTVGQRKGLGISYREPLYVLEIDTEYNRLVVGPDSEMFKRQFTVMGTNWFIDATDGNEIVCEAKIRYRHEPARCRVRISASSEAEVEFAVPQRAITPGQSAVFYAGDFLLGGGIIAGPH